MTRLLTALPVLGVSTLVTHNQDANALVIRSVDHRVGEVGQGMGLSAVAGRCAQARMLLQQLCDSFKLSEKTASKTGSSLSLVEANGLCQVLRSEPVD